MKNHFLQYVMAPITIALCVISSTANGYNGLDYEWGTLLAKIKQTLPDDTKYTQFTPREKPKYKNRILTYITAIDNKLLDKIIILRIESSPLVDYLFVNNKLYSIIENWKKIDNKVERGIRLRLTKQFGKPQIQQDKNFYIYSFANDKTKVFWYLMRRSDGKSECMIYYYTTQIFRMMISE